MDTSDGAAVDGGGEDDEHEEEVVVSAPGGNLDTTLTVDHFIDSSVVGKVQRFSLREGSSRLSRPLDKMKRPRIAGSFSSESISPALFLSTHDSEAFLGAGASPVANQGRAALWFRFVKQLCDVTLQADSIRLQLSELSRDFGPFRDYIVTRSQPSNSSAEQPHHDQVIAEKMFAEWMQCVSAFCYSVRVKYKLEILYMLSEEF